MVGMAECAGHRGLRILASRSGAAGALIVAASPDGPGVAPLLMAEFLDNRTANAVAVFASR